MTGKTRLGEEGYGVRRVGSFAGKTPDAGSGPHPVGIITRLALDGYGVKRAGNFSGKGGGHPVGIITRLSLDGYGVRRYSSFAGKTPSGGGGGAHPVHIITRLSLDGYGVKRYSTFAGKTQSGTTPIVPVVLEPQYTGPYSGWERKRTKYERLQHDQEERERVARKHDFQRIVKAVVHPPKPEEKPVKRKKTQPDTPLDVRPLEIAKLEATAAKARVVSSEITARSNLAEKRQRAAIAEQARLERLANDNLALMLLLTS